MQRILVFCCVIFFLQVNVEAKDRIHVLFIGNNLTTENNLPKLVSMLSAAYGKEIMYETICFPGHNLEDHWEDGSAQSEIAKGKFDVVILQQGPPSDTDQQEVLTEFGKRFEELCRKHSTQLIYFMPWTTTSEVREFDQVLNAYTEITSDGNTRLIPVGIAWKNALEKYPQLKLYTHDALHPTLAGSLLAAIMITAVLVQDTELQLLDHRSIKTEVSSSEIRILLTLAREALANVSASR
ncbi:MAG TPA: hypothetical protein PKC24_00575 [Cyclobacteriaceae bacterium]|nr:hypothetical protein [Cyclobacteriaceae bacterium]